MELATDQMYLDNAEQAKRRDYDLAWKAGFASFHEGLAQCEAEFACRKYACRTGYMDGWLDAHYQDRARVAAMRCGPCGF